MRARLEGLIGEVRRRREQRWCPHTPTPQQARFLELDCLEALYGGAAGGGKSDAELMAALQYADVPSYNAILFRKTYADLAQPGALMDRAAQWLRPTAAEWNEQKKRWRFPAGATLGFGYLETDSDRYRYAGTEYQFIGWDELTQWATDVPYTFLFSRLRRLAGVDVPLRVRAATNPGGPGHDWVAKRFGLQTDGTQDEDLARDPRTGEIRVFVPAKLVDNPFLDQASYRLSLRQMDEKTRQQLEDGLWVRDSGGLIYPIRAHNLVDALPPRKGWIWVLAVDLGAGQAKPSTSFCVLAYHPNHTDVYAAQSELRGGMIPTTIAERMRALEADFEAFESVVVDEGGLGKGYGDEFREVHEIPTKPADKKNKLGFRKNIRGALERGDLLVVEPANAALIAEAGKVEWNEEGIDVAEGVACHVTDALLYGWRACKPHLAEPPETRLAPRDPGYDDQYAAELKDREIERARRRSKSKWWAR